MNPTEMTRVLVEVEKNIKTVARAKRRIAYPQDWGLSD